MQKLRNRILNVDLASN